MDNIQLTDERLRHLNANQPARERLCLAVLALDRTYSNVKPRRPEGGPDGGVDIVCIKNGCECLVGVGFVNRAADTSDDKRKIKRKFREDVESAKKFSSDAKHFVFLTNIDLTPAEIRGLSDHGQVAGFDSIDIYYRERITQILNTPEGLASRFNYLGIELSAAEQSSFFSRFNDDLAAIIGGGFNGVAEQIESLRFELWRKSTIRSIKVDARFKTYERYYEGDKLAGQPFIICVELQSPGAEQAMMFGFKENHSTNAETPQFGEKHFFWRQVEGEIKDVKWSKCRMWGGETPGISGGFSWRRLTGLHHDYS